MENAQLAGELFEVSTGLIDENPSRPCSHCHVRMTPGRVRYCEDCQYWRNIWTWYRVTPEDFETMLQAQMHRCAVCSEPFGDERPRVDHKHGCNHPGRYPREYPKSRLYPCCRDCVRGLICTGCNTLLGMLETRSDILASALRYLGVEIGEAVLRMTLRDASELLYPAVCR